MNNLVFNNEADQLKTSIYAQAPDLTFQPLQISSDGFLQVEGRFSLSNSVTVSEITSPVTIANAITVSEITSPITVSEITSPVTIAMP